MFNTSLRRFQKFIPALKIAMASASLVLMIFLILQTSPQLENILAFALLLFLFLSLFSSFLFPPMVAFVIGSLVSVVLFLRATNLLTGVNILLLLVFEGTLLWPFFTKLRKKE